MIAETGHALAAAAAESLIEDLFDVARALHSRPELSGEEHHASALLAARLEAEQFLVERGTGDLPTAFVARRGSPGSPAVAFLAEYDALPDIGHGCGHNLIAAAALGAGIALARALPSGAGEVRVIGTPAEETLGGKVILAERGVFKGLDAALMVHPAHEERVLTQSLACQSLRITYHGREAHAVAHPEKGINALDPLLALFAARDALARRSRPGVRMPGVILEGGRRPNIVPERAVGHFTLRAPDGAERDRLAHEIRRLAVALGEAHGCRTEVIATDRAYDEMCTNVALADAYRGHLQALGMTVDDRPRRSMGSLDMGNVSQMVPSLHPFFAIVGPGTASHTREFAAATLSEAGKAGLLRSVKALALTGLDVLLDADLRRRAVEEHRLLHRDPRAGS